MNISELLKESTNGLLSEESLKQIEEGFEAAVNDRVKVHVEKALAEQDTQYTEQLETLLKAIDADHTKKLHRIVEAIDKNNTAKLQQVIKKYSNAITEQASGFKKDLVKKIGKYLDVYLEKSVPQEAINEAVKNKKAAIVLENLRKSLAIDTAVMMDSVRDAVVDGHQQIQEATAAAEQYKQKAERFKNDLQVLKANLVFEQKTSNLSSEKREYARRVLEGKSAQFIVENLDYTLSLFDRTEEERLDVLREQAQEQRKVKDHRIVTEAAEEVDPEDQEIPIIESALTSSYLSELAQY